MLGIDVSKDTLACTLFDPNTHKPLWNKNFPNTRQGIARLLKQTPVDCPWALEPTGRYSTAPATFARQAGRSVLDAACCWPNPSALAPSCTPFRTAPRLTSSIARASACLLYHGLCRPIRLNLR